MSENYVSDKRSIYGVWSIQSTPTTQHQKADKQTTPFKNEAGT